MLYNTPAKPCSWGTSPPLDRSGSGAFSRPARAAAGQECVRRRVSPGGHPTQPPTRRRLRPGERQHPSTPTAPHRRSSRAAPGSSSPPVQPRTPSRHHHRDQPRTADRGSSAPARPAGSRNRSFNTPALPPLTLTGPAPEWVELPTRQRQLSRVPVFAPSPRTCDTPASPTTLIVQHALGETRTP